MQTSCSTRYDRGKGLPELGTHAHVDKEVDARINGEQQKDKMNHGQKEIMVSFEIVIVGINQEDV